MGGKRLGLGKELNIHRTKKRGGKLSKGRDERRTFLLSKTREEHLTKKKGNHRVSMDFKKRRKKKKTDPLTTVCRTVKREPWVSMQQGRGDGLARDRKKLER